MLGIGKLLVGGLVAVGIGVGGVALSSTFKSENSVSQEIVERMEFTPVSVKKCKVFEIDPSASKGKTIKLVELGEEGAFLGGLDESRNSQFIQQVKDACGRRLKTKDSANVYVARKNDQWTYDRLYQNTWTLVDSYRV